MRHTIVIPGLDLLKVKNLPQLNFLAERYNVIVFVSEIFVEDIPLTFTIVNCGYGRLSVLKRLFYLLKILVTCGNVKAIEIYPESIWDFIYVFLGRMFRKKIIILARGNELKYINHEYNLLQRFFFFLTYKFCDFIFYREHYASSFIKSFYKPTFYIHNSIDDSHQQVKYSLPFKFVFVNSFKLFRYPEVALEAFILNCSENFDFKTNCVLELYGFNVGENDESRRRCIALASNYSNVFIKEFQLDVSRIYEDSHVFILPADIVFLNNSLIESMSFGIVPIISKVDRSDLIIEDNVNGFLVEGYNIEKWAKKMLEVFRNRSAFDEMSELSKKSVLQRFGRSEYLLKLDQAYSEIFQ